MSKGSPGNLSIRKPFVLPDQKNPLPKWNADEIMPGPPFDRLDPMYRLGFGAGYQAALLQLQQQ